MQTNKEYGELVLFFSKELCSAKTITTSRIIADVFEKDHKHVLEDITRLKKELKETNEVRSSLPPSLTIKEDPCVEVKPNYIEECPFIYVNNTQIQVRK